MSQSRDLHECPPQIGESIRRLRFSDVLQWAYVMYNSSIADGATHHGEERRGLLDLARRRMRHYEAMLESIPMHTVEHLFLGRCIEGAMSYASGLISARGNLEKDREEAEERRRIRREAELVNITTEGMFRASVRLIVVGLLTFSLVYLFQIRVKHANPDELSWSSLFTSVSTALGAVLLGMTYQIKRLANAHSSIDAAYYVAVDAAKQRQADRIEASLTRLADHFQVAWLDFTGQQGDAERLDMLGEQEIIRMNHRRHAIAPEPSWWETAYVATCRIGHTLRNRGATAVAAAESKPDQP